MRPMQARGCVLVVDTDDLMPVLAAGMVNGGRDAARRERGEASRFFGQLRAMKTASTQIAASAPGAALHASMRSHRTEYAATSARMVACG